MLIDEPLRSASAYCDIFVPRNKPHSSGPDWKWCGEDMTEIDGKWTCPKHGVWEDAIKTKPHGGFSTLREAGLWDGRA